MKVLLAALAASTALCGVAHAQSPATCPGGQINPNRMHIGVGPCDVPATADVAEALAKARAALPGAQVGTPGGPPTSPDGTAGGMMVQPRGLSATRPLADRLRDHISIRDFLPYPACDGTADDSPTVAAAMTAMAGTDRAVAVPGDCRLNIGPAARLAGNRIVLDGTGLVGEGGRDSGYPYGQRGSTLLLTDPAAPAFIGKRNWRLERLTYFWPGQTEAAATANGGVPVTMPPLVSTASAVGLPAAEATAFFFRDNDIINGWDVLDLSHDVSGGFHVDGNRSFHLHAFLQLNTMPVESWVQGNHFTPNGYQAAPGMLGLYPTHYMLDYAASHASDVLAVGDGTAAKGASHTIDALHFVSNYTFGMGYGLRAIGGTYNLGEWSGNGFDGVPRPVSIETGGLITGGTTLLGGRIYSYTLTQPTPAAPNRQMLPTLTPAIYVAPDSAPGGSLAISSVSLPSATAGFVDWQGAQGSLDVLASQIDGPNNGGSTTPVSAIRMASQGGRLRVVGNRINEGGTTPGYGVEITLPLQVMSIIGNEFISALAPISVGGPFSTPGKVAANTAIATSGPTAIVGAQGGSVEDFENTWDVASAGWSHRQRGADGALQLSFRGASAFALTPDGSLTVPGRVLGGGLPPATRAYASAAQTFTGPKTVVTFDAATLDTTGAYAGSTFTAPEAGLYYVYAQMEQDGVAATTGDVWTMSIDQAGSIVRTAVRDAAVTKGQPTALTVEDQVQMAAGDTVKIGLVRLQGTGTLATVPDGTRSRLIVRKAQ